MESILLIGFAISVAFNILFLVKIIVKKPEFIIEEGAVDNDNISSWSGIKLRIVHQGFFNKVSQIE